MLWRFLNFCPEVHFHYTKVVVEKPEKTRRDQRCYYRYCTTKFIVCSVASGTASSLTKARRFYYDFQPYYFPVEKDNKYQHNILSLSVYWHHFTYICDVSNYDVERMSPVLNKREQPVQLVAIFPLQLH